MNGNYRHVLISILFLIIFILFLLFVLNSQLSSKKSNVSSNGGSYHGSYRYKYSKIDRSKKYSSVGEVTLPRRLEPESFVSFSNIEGENFLISNFESNEYLCTGSCVCQQIFRRANFPLVREIIYLAAAATSVIAMNLAKEYFSEECVKKMIDDCPETAIRSEVEICETIEEDHEDWDEDEDEDEDEDDFEVIRYHCDGHCYPFRYETKYPEDEIEKLKELVKCVGLETHKQFADINNFGVEHIKNMFIQTVLSPFCLEQSKDFYEGVDNELKSYPMCTALKPDWTNPTVVCIDMKTKSYKDFWDPSTN